MKKIIEKLKHRLDSISTKSMNGDSMSGFCDGKEAIKFIKSYIEVEYKLDQVIKITNILYDNLKKHKKLELDKATILLIEKTIKNKLNK